MRKKYIDNIRWITVALVVIYHAFYIFNGSGVLGGVGSFLLPCGQEKLNLMEGGTIQRGYRMKNYTQVYVKSSLVGKYDI